MEPKQVEPKQVGNVDRKEIRRQATMEAREATRQEIQKMWRIVGMASAALIGLISVAFGAVVLSKGLRRKFEANAETHRVNVEAFTERAEKTARAYFEAATVEARAALVADRARVQPLMEAHYKTHPLESWRFLKLLEPNYHPASKRDFLITLGSFEGEPDKTLIFELDKDGQVGLQWEVLSRHSDMTWEDFLSKKPTTNQRMRVSLQSADYYNFAFDANAVESFEILHGGSPASLFGYLKKDSPSYANLKKVQLMADTTLLPVIAELKFPENAPSSDQVWIDKIISFSWIEGVDM